MKINTHLSSPAFLSLLFPSFFSWLALELIKVTKGVLIAFPHRFSLMRATPVNHLNITLTLPFLISVLSAFSLHLSSHFSFSLFSFSPCEKCKRAGNHLDTDKLFLCLSIPLIIQESPECRYAFLSFPFRPHSIGGRPTCKSPEYNVVNTNLSFP